MHPHSDTPCLTLTASRQRRAWAVISCLCSFASNRRYEFNSRAATRNSLKYSCFDGDAFGTGARPIPKDIILLSRTPQFGVKYEIVFEHCRK